MEWLNRRNSAVPIVMYHRVLGIAGRGVMPSCMEIIGMAVTEPQFEEQMSYLTSRYTVVPLSDYLAWRKGGEALPDRALVITFDDGYSDNGEVASRVLEKYRATATFFVIGNAVSSRDEVWPYEIYRLMDALDGRKVSIENDGEGRILLDFSTERGKRGSVATIRRLLRAGDDRPLNRIAETLRLRLREEGADVPSGYEEFMSSGDLRLLHERGFTIGAHSQSHRRMADLDEEEQSRELAGVHRLVREITGEAELPFAYPYGQESDLGLATTRLVAEAGYSCALTTVEGLNDVTTDLYRLRRIEMGPVPRSEYALRITGIVGRGKSIIKRALGRN
ncbi:MAG: polysaccharide deacetylase family protein [Candidatus Geothermincolia bacterium]